MCLFPILVLALSLSNGHPTASPKPRFASGFCGIYLTQHQKNELGVGAN